jgi:hypothetical protein
MDIPLLKAGGTRNGQVRFHSQAAHLWELAAGVGKESIYY